jgi:hypothetical protein
VLVPADILTALFFDIAGVGDLFAASSAKSALLGSGSVIYYDTDGASGVPGSTTCDAAGTTSCIVNGGDVGGEWAYKSGLAGAPQGATEGISSAGFGLFGSSDLIGIVGLAPPPSPDGPNYGILSAGDDTTTGNSGVMGPGPLGDPKPQGQIKNQVVFTFTGALTGTATSSDISHVSFQYGTGLDEPNFPPVPEPGAMLLLGAGLAGLWGYNRLRSG